MVKGQITVEASFIIPIFIVIICSFVYETLLACDRGAINMAVDEYLQEVIADSNTEPITRDILSKRLFIYEIENVVVEENNNNLTVNVKAVPVVSAGIIAGLADSFKNYEIERTVNTENICNSFRRISVVKDET